LRQLADQRFAVVAFAGLLVLLSAFLRTQAIDAPFWIDEGLSTGIASHHLFSIPSVLAHDGSPPLYYMLLHVWMRIFGGGEIPAHALSVVIAVATVPIALWGGWSLFDRRTGLICACLFAVNPFATQYAVETRMYALVMLLGLTMVIGFLHGFVFRRRGYLILFAASLVLMCYTHAWGLFVGVGCVIAFGFCLWRSDNRRPLLVDGILSFGAVAVLFAPWLPMLVHQALHNGAPWVNSPKLGAPVQISRAILGGSQPTVAVVLAAGAGLTAFIQPKLRGAYRTAVIAMFLLALCTLVVAWLYSQISPAWTTRYLAAIVGPSLLLVALGFARARVVGLVALALVAAFWIPPKTQALEHKSNVRDVAVEANPGLVPGDLVVSTHPEEIPVLNYYLRPGLNYATPMGPTADPRIMDWTDALARLRTAQPQTDLAPLLATLPPGHHVLLVRPMTTTTNDWTAPWTQLVRRRSAQWGMALQGDTRFVRSATVPHFFSDVTPQNGVRAILYTKVQNR
jgi:hypothetical protein